MTKVSIEGTKFLVDGRPTYAGRTYDGHSIEGLLFNVRAVQATFDDANPETRRHWAYPDTGTWDPERNVEEFCQALPAWRDHGVLGFTLNFQGGGAYFAPEIYQAFDNNAFTPEGHLKGAYAARMARVLNRADELGMVPIVGLFYGVQLAKLQGEEAVWQAADEALSFLASTGHRNLLIELANEVEIVVRFAGYEMFDPEHVHEMINQLRSRYPQFLYSASQVGINAEKGKGIPPASLVTAADYVLIHGNGTRAAELAAGIDVVKALPAYQAAPKPLMINEDSPGIPNLEVAWRRGVSWGYFDQGYGGEAAWAGDAYVDYRAKPREDTYDALSGFQTPPVNWGINTEHKRAFFERVAEITGAPALNR